MGAPKSSRRYLRPDRRVLGNPATRAFAELLIDCEWRTGLSGRCWSACSGRATEVVRLLKPT